MQACTHTYIHTCTGAPWRMTPPRRRTSSAKASVSVCRPFWNEKTPCGPPCVNKRACVCSFASMHAGIQACAFNTQTHTHTHTHSRTHSRTHTSHTHGYVCIHIAFIHVHPCMKACEQASIHACVCARARVRVFMFRQGTRVFTAHFIARSMAGSMRVLFPPPNKPPSTSEP